MTLGNRIGQYRRKLGLTQEALARQLDVTNQAVSKWESDQSCPDISLLPRLADIFGITMDELFGRAAAKTKPSAEPEIPKEPEQPRKERKKSFFERLFHETIRDFDHRADPGREMPLPEDVEPDWEDDETLRVVLFVGKKLISGHPVARRIEVHCNGPVMNLYSAFDVTCNAVNGNLWARGDVTCDCVGGGVRAGGDVTCDGVNGYVQAHGDVSCDQIQGDVNAGGDVDSADILGNVTASGDVSCGDIQGNVRAGGDVSCDTLEGSITAGGSVSIG